MAFNHCMDCFVSVFYLKLLTEVKRDTTASLWENTPLPCLWPQLSLHFHGASGQEGWTSPAPYMSPWGHLEDSPYLLRLQDGVTFPKLLDSIPLSCSEQKHLYSPFWEILCSRQRFLLGVSFVCVHPPPQLPPSWQSGETPASLLSPTLLIKTDTHTCKQRPHPQPLANSKEKPIPQNISFWTAFDLHVGKPWGEILIHNGLNLSKHLLD